MEDLNPTHPRCYVLTPLRYLVHKTAGESWYSSLCATQAVFSRDGCPGITRTKSHVHNLAERGVLAPVEIMFRLGYYQHVYSSVRGNNLDVKSG